MFTIQSGNRVKKPMRWTVQSAVLFIFIVICITGCGVRLPIPIPTVASTFESTNPPKPIPTNTISTPTTLQPTIIGHLELSPFLSENVGPFILITNGQIEIQDASGSTLQVLHKYDQPYGSYFPYLAWSPDATKLAFVELGINDIKVLDLSKLDTEYITTSQDIFERDPSWSPDGKRLVFAATYREADQYHNSLFIMNADGSDNQQIYPCKSECMRPDWSPTGEFITFEENGEIFILNTDGKRVNNLTNGNGYNSVPRWSPDGKQIAFIHGDQINSRGFLAAMDSDGGNFALLTDNSVWLWWYVEWSASGRYLLVSAEYPGSEPAIYAYDLVSKKFTLINYFSNGWPVWFPIRLPVYDDNDFVQHQPCAQKDWSRIKAGDLVSILGETGETLRVHSSPTFEENVVAVLRSGTIVRALEGPVCIDKYVFWKVLGYSIPGAYGWIAEGTNTDYYFEPVGY